MRRLSKTREYCAAKGASSNSGEPAVRFGSRPARIALERVILIRRGINAIPRELYRRDIAFVAARSELRTGRFEVAEVLVSEGAMRERCNRCGVLVDRHVWKVLASAGSDNASLEPASVINRRSTAPLRRAISRQITRNRRRAGRSHRAHSFPQNLATRILREIATPFPPFSNFGRVPQRRCSAATRRFLRTSSSESGRQHCA